MQAPLKNFAVEGPFAIRRRRFFDGWSLRDVDSRNTMTTVIVFGLCQRRLEEKKARFDLLEVNEPLVHGRKNDNGTYWRIIERKEAA